MFGILNIFKPSGMTSHDAVNYIRKITGVKQIGHTGTLDPFAEGVLPVCIGKAARLIEFLPDDKEYSAVVQFGKSTDTYDLEGEITSISDKKITSNDVETALKNFEGEIEQLPPLYSAIKVKGKKLYDYARKGEHAEIKPRKVTIEKIELKNFDEELQTAEILVKCSKGTYIRSIAHDLGQRLETGGYLTKLLRTKAGKFRIENSLHLEYLKENFSEHLLINPLEVLDLPVKHVADTELEKIKHGQALKNADVGCDKTVILVYNGNTICAVGCTDFDRIFIKKVFL